ncbi:MAG TPA: TPM domain-containing protein, partial [Gemmatimonadales bacterium]|nr:TPM domain-containing protein [Gemmatimonadales bacterium]
MLALLIVLAQVAIPPPHGFVNDFAGVLDAASVQHMEQVIAEVRNATRGDIAVVTLSDIGDRAASDVAVEIGRQWGVGAKGEAGDRTKNLGVVVLLVPRKNHRPGTGDIFIATGRGAEGFLTDATTGRIRDAMLPALAQEQYGPALSLGVDLIAQAFANEFGVTLTTPDVVQPPPQNPAPQIPIGWIIAAIVLLIVVSRGRILLLPFWLGGMGRGGGRG